MASLVVVVVIVVIVVTVEVELVVVVVIVTYVQYPELSCTRAMYLPYLTMCPRHI